MSKHTPGPWTFKRESSPYPNWYLVYSEYSDPPLIVQVLRGTSVVGLQSNADYYTYKTPREVAAEANARLIAAAPDLLNALTTGAQLNMPDFLEWIAARLVKVHGDDPNVDYVQTLRHRAKLCREAIAKATGNGA